MKSKVNGYSAEVYSYNLVALNKGKAGKVLSAKPKLLYRDFVDGYNSVNTESKYIKVKKK